MTAETPQDDALSAGTSPLEAMRWLADSVAGWPFEELIRTYRESEQA
jgi:hypothetical protein